MSRTIVFDNGAGALKAGLAGDLRPSHSMPNTLARVKNQQQVQRTTAILQLTHELVGPRVGLACFIAAAQTCDLR